MVLLVPTVGVANVVGTTVLVGYVDGNIDGVDVGCLCRTLLEGTIQHSMIRNASTLAIVFSTVESNLTQISSNQMDHPSDFSECK